MLPVILALGVELAGAAMWTDVLWRRVQSNTDTVGFVLAMIAVFMLLPVFAMISGYGLYYLLMEVAR